MTAATTFAIVLTVISMSEARVGWLPSNRTNRNATTYYTSRTTQELLRNVQSDLTPEKRVICQLSSPGMTALSVKFVSMIQNCRAELKYGTVHLSNLRLTDFRLDHHLNIRGVGIRYGPPVDIINLSMDVEAVATLNSSLCREGTMQPIPCTVKIEFGKTLFSLRAHWPFNNIRMKCDIARIANFEPSWIGLDILFNGRTRQRDTSNKRTYMKGEEAWHSIMDMIYSAMPGPNIVKGVLSNFAQLVVS